MSEAIVGCIGLVTILLLFFSGMELPFSMILVGFVGFSYLVNVEAAIYMVAMNLYEVFASYSYTVFPIFIFMGQIAFASGIAKRLYSTADHFVGHVPGGLALATVGGATAFKALCGSAVATAATFTSVAIPEMDRYHYDKRLSTGLVATVGTLGVLVPPSVYLIIFGLITEQSIGKLFIAGIIPGLTIAVVFALTILVWVKINPSIAPRGKRSTWKERMLGLPELMLVLGIFLGMIGGLLKGFFTPSEAGSVGVTALFLLVIFRRQLGLRPFFRAISESIRTACMVLMLIGGSIILGNFISVTNISQLLADWVSVVPISGNLIMVFICFVYMIGGSFIDDLSFMIIATPIFFPAVLKLGFDPIWFGIMIGVTQMIGIVIPPVAANVFIVHKMSNTSLATVYKGVAPFLLGLSFVGALLLIFPQFALFLPNWLMG